MGSKSHADTGVVKADHRHFLTIVPAKWQRAGVAADLAGTVELDPLADAERALSNHHGRTLPARGTVGRETVMMKRGQCRVQVGGGYMRLPLSCLFAANDLANSPIGIPRLYGELRRKNLRLAVVGSVTEMRLLFVERDAATLDQPFANETFVLS